MQQIYLTENEQAIVHTPFGAVVVSSQALGETQHIYVTPPEEFKRRVERPSKYTTIYERAA